MEEFGIHVSSTGMSSEPGFWAGYWYYLTHPSAMDDDLETAFYWSLGTGTVAGAAASGLALAGANVVLWGGAAATAEAAASSSLAATTVIVTPAGTTAVGSTVIQSSAIGYSTLATSMQTVAVGTEVVMVGNASTTTFSFVTSAGAIAFGHGVRKLAARGLSQAAVETAIAMDIVATGAGGGSVLINGLTVLYRTRMLDNLIWVGTYFVP